MMVNGRVFYVGRARSPVRHGRKTGGAGRLVDCYLGSLNLAEPVLSVFKAREAMRSNSSVSDKQRRSRAKGALPEGNGHFWPTAVSFGLNVASATPAVSFVAFGSKPAIQN
jgi:hypothetical protein